jgi:sulfoxide reductase catalytic subunit YedY
MTVPWAGFPLKSLVAMAKPQASAKYVRFETFFDPKMADGQNSFLYPWPYIEGVTMEEAGNDLAFIVTGAYDKPVAQQHGAPLRLHLPWKYGFKSIKSIRKISFVEERPVGLWEALQPSEYGFWANVNPEVPHPRWSQAMERVLGTGEMVPTQLYNGYAEQVSQLYAGMDPSTLYM